MSYEKSWLISIREKRKREERENRKRRSRKERNRDSRKDNENLKKRDKKELSIRNCIYKSLSLILIIISYL